MIVDSHLHLWNAEASETPWRPGWARFAHSSRFDAADAISAMDEVGVGFAAIIPAAWDVLGNDLIIEASRSYPDRFAAFPSPDLKRRDAEQLASWRDRGARGFRVFFPPSASSSWLRDGRADWFWPAAERAGLPVMVWAPGQTDAIASICRGHPGLRILVDHLNLGMQPRGGEAAREVDVLTGLAAIADVTVKASALPCAGPEALSLLRTVVDAFGPERVFWGSDLGRLGIPYREVVQMVRDSPWGTLGEKELVLGRAFLDWLG